MHSTGVLFAARPLAMDSENQVINLCIEGTQAEFKGQIDGARALYQQAWEAAQDDFEACIAAHYVARYQENPETRLYWNRVALERAKMVADGRVKDFYPSLYLNMGQSYELLGDQQEAQRYFDMASKLGVIHHMEHPEVRE